MITGDEIEFVDGPKIQYKTRYPQFSDVEINLIKDEIDKLRTKDIIKRTCHEEKEIS